MGVASIALASSGGGISSSSAAAALAAAGVRPSSRERPISRERPASRETNGSNKPCLAIMLATETATLGQRKPPIPPRTGIIGGTKGADVPLAQAVGPGARPLNTQEHSDASKSAHSSGCTEIVKDELVEVDVTSEDEMPVQSATTGRNVPVSNASSHAAIPNGNIAASCSTVAANACEEDVLMEVDVTSEDEMPVQSATTSRNVPVGNASSHAAIPKGDIAASCSTVAASACEEEHRTDHEEHVRGLARADSTGQRPTLPSQPGASIPTVCSAPRRASSNRRECEEYTSRAADNDHRWLDSLGVVRESAEKKPPKMLRDCTEGANAETRRWITRLQRHERGSFGSALLLASRPFDGEFAEE